ncbi:MAG: hypothetical protein QF819_05090 [Gemmatimonadota bacterium]|jgi:hypothetical protein|nr:hypothetical protein [Gemmatimonadota bacterium]MDP6802536.1 hypothetical protein [Gemmatimonadota bacterium]MDP7031799.1 hypothetical protein [Gemmatimonadota bacterium]
MAGAIPKRSVLVRIRMADGETREGMLYLDYIDAIHRGEQTLLDKLNDDYPWFPLGDATDGTTGIVNRSQVVLVEPGKGTPAEALRTPATGTFREESVTVELSGGEKIHGRVAMDLPEEFSRVSDFLNFPECFFALETSDGPVLIAKDHLFLLTPHEDPPPMPETLDTETGRNA